MPASSSWPERSIARCRITSYRGPPSFSTTSASPSKEARSAWREWPIRKTLTIRERVPSFELMELLLRRGAELTYSDPHVPRLPKMRHFDLPNDDEPGTDASFPAVARRRPDRDGPLSFRLRHDRQACTVGDRHPQRNGQRQRQPREDSKDLSRERRVPSRKNSASLSHSHSPLSHSPLTHSPLTTHHSRTHHSPLALALATPTRTSSPHSLAHAGGDLLERVAGIVFHQLGVNQVRLAAVLPGRAEGLSICRLRSRRSGFRLGRIPSSAGRNPRVESRCTSSRLGAGIVRSRSRGCPRRSRSDCDLEPIAC